MDSKKRDLILSAWAVKKKDALTFTDIRTFLEEKRVLEKKEKVKSRVYLSRWLNELVKNNDIQKKVQGRRSEYRLVRNPVEFKVFDYLNNLRAKYSNIVPRESGDEGWRKSFFLCLGFNEKILPETKQEVFAFDLLTKRLIAVFEALHLLRNTIVLREAYLGTGIIFPFYETTKREVLLSAICERMKLEENESIAEKYGLAKEEVFQMFLKPSKQNEELAKYITLNEVEEWVSDLTLKNVYRNTDWYKERLRQNRINLDAYNVSYFIAKLAPIWEQVEASNRLSFEKEIPEPMSKEDLKLRKKLNLYRLAVMVKIAMNMKELNVDLDDFAVVITRHKESMAKNWTVEHGLYEEWRRIKATRDGKPPNLMYEAYRDFIVADPLKALATILADTPVEAVEFEKLKEKPWVQIEFGKNYDLFLKYYEEELKRVREERKNIFIKK